MEYLRAVILYGNSIVLASVGASLQRAGFSVTRLAPPLPGPAELAALHPDVILFDMESGHPDAAFSLLQSCPGLLLLGMNPDGNTMRMWSGPQYAELSTKELTALIEAGLSLPSSPAGAVSRVSAATKPD